MFFYKSILYLIISMPHFLYGIIIKNDRLNTLLKILNKNISHPQINRQLSLYSKID